MDETARLALPLIVAGQAQKEIAHNEALTILDACVAACVEERSLDRPPAMPTIGQSHIVAAEAMAPWDEFVGSLAVATAGGWRFIAPRAGLRVWVVSEGIDAVFHDGQWHYGDVRGSGLTVGGEQVVGAQRAAIGDPSGGVLVDTECRTAISALLAAMRGHGLIAS